MIAGGQRRTTRPRPQATEQLRYTDVISRDGRVYSIVREKAAYAEGTGQAPFMFRVKFDMETPAGRSAQNAAQYLAQTSAIYPDQLYAIRAVEYICIANVKENTISYLYAGWTDGNGHVIAEFPIDKSHPYVKARFNEAKRFDNFAILRTATDPDVEAVFTMAALFMGDKHLRPRAPTPQAQPVESEEELEFKRQVRELARMSPAHLVKLAATIDLLERITRELQTAGIPKYFLSEDPVGESGKVENAVNDCLKFLPAGFMPNMLRDSRQALLDAWIVDLAVKAGTVDAQVLTIIDRYQLTGKSLAKLSSEVLKVAQASNDFASGMLRLALK
jgi:hypothetical protein